MCSQFPGNGLSSLEIVYLYAEITIILEEEEFIV